jgi:hypothetical protein
MAVTATLLPTVATALAALTTLATAIPAIAPFAAIAALMSLLALTLGGLLSFGGGCGCFASSRLPAATPRLASR